MWMRGLGTSWCGPSFRAPAGAIRPGWSVVASVSAQIGEDPAEPVGIQISARTVPGGGVADPIVEDEDPEGTCPDPIKAERLTTCSACHAPSYGPLFWRYKIPIQDPGPGSIVRYLQQAIARLAEQSPVLLMVPVGVSQWAVPMAAALDRALQLEPKT